MFDVLPIIVEYCEKNHGLIGTDVLNIDSTKLVNKFMAEETGISKIYEAKVRLKKMSPLILWRIKSVSLSTTNSYGKTKNITGRKSPWTSSTRRD